MPLEEYRKKRKFEVTPEPDGGAAAKMPSGTSGRFVVQEHHASMLHFDFRLEIDGVLKSWSIPKGPSLDPATRRLAVEVEDHPLEYADFHGTIPKGSYGAGEVFLWDQGQFTCTDKDALSAWEAGSLHLNLAGKRLNGGFRLRRTKEGRKPQWILQKAQDEFAVEGHEAERIKKDTTSRLQWQGGHGARSLTPEPPQIERTLSPPAEGAITAQEFLSSHQVKGNVTLDLDGERVKLTHLEKIYWQKEKISKGDLLRYYLSLAPVMVPFLKDRPAILKRYPQGTDHEPFYQHDLSTAIDFLHAVRLDSEFGKPVDYAVYSTAASLLYLVNLGTVEQHPWHSRVQDLSKPDWLILDLDPCDATWDALVHSALVLREVVQGASLTPLLKTSGSRGLHLYVPLEPEHTYSQVFNFAKNLCSTAQKRLPGIATMKRNLADRRRGEVYLDYMQNAAGKSVASVYSVRAKPGATVSCPLSWEELEAGAALQDFNLHSVPDRVARGVDPWGDVAKVKGRLVEEPPRPKRRVAAS